MTFECAVPISKSQGKTLDFKGRQNMHFTAYSLASKIVHLYRLLKETPSVLMHSSENF